ncbi:MTRF1L release factor glutamine methyltransferase-like [Ruditapes philippinarum]|uniref:MTRF1L release factor glutamine methyltransferase-like n=1 Tax=Ruditapes philippinarum TaxID=129788 RepID=UPI00295A7F81|nr:MTRF1L release factor glutamine methyltransferase-like [Ruditapes philippinarum]
MVHMVHLVRRCLFKLSVSRKTYITNFHSSTARPIFTILGQYQSPYYSTVREISGRPERILPNLIQSWTERLARAEVPEANSSVNLIVAHALGKKMIHEVDMNIVPTEVSLKAIEDMISERLKRVPVQYIIGEWDFHDMTLEMKEPVLIPRPETEELAAMIVNQWPLSRDQTGRFLEIGCGTGALSMYILRQLPKVTCTAVDKNETACELTLRNASRYNLQHRIHVIHGDIRAGIVKLMKPNITFLNISQTKTVSLINACKFIFSYEDHDALYGGTDGLDLVRKILTESGKLLKDKQSYVWLEVGLGHPEKIRRIVELQPKFMLSYKETLKDFTGRGRFCKLQLNTM